MIKAAERSMEEVNTLLFDDEVQEFSSKDHAIDSEPQKSAPRLLKQKELFSELDGLEPVPYYKRPIVQGAMVLVVAIPVGWGLLSAFGNGEPTNTQLQSANLTGDSETQLLKDSLEQERKKNQDLVVENGLKTQQLKVIPAKPKPTQQPARQTVVVRPQPTPTPILTPRRVSTPPRKVSTPSRSYIASQPTVYKSTPPTPKPNFQPVKLISSPEKVKPEKKPIEQWIAASNVGSFGSVSSASNAQPETVLSNRDRDTVDNYQAAAEQANSSTTATTSDFNAEPVSEISGGSGSAPEEVTITQSTAYTNYPDSETPQHSGFNALASNRIVQSDNSNYQTASYSTTTPQLIADRSRNFQTVQSDDSNYQTVNYTDTIPQLIVGTRAEGKLETGVAWSGELSNATRSLLIQLSEPLLAADNTVAIPKGAYLVARVDNATDSGLLEMSVVAVLVKQNGRTIEKPLSESAIQNHTIQILGKGGNYLQAKTNRRSNTPNDVGMALLSGASRVAGLTNQSNFQSTYSNGDFTSTTESRDPNYLAGFGQGAAAEILRQQRERGEQIQQSTESQPNVFVLGRGTAVQVYVNQTTPFK